MIIYSVDTSLGHEFLHLASSYYDKENKTAFVDLDKNLLVQE